MADWKKVLVSGSDIHISSITASNVPEGASGDRVLVRTTADGGFKSVTQGSIQGVTEATFQISGSGIFDTASFDGTQDVLLFTGSANSGLSVDVSKVSDLTTVTVNLPEGTISGSSQITLSETNGFTTFSQSLATDISGNLGNINAALASITELESELVDLNATASLLIATSESVASDLNDQSLDITNLQSSIGALETFSSSVVDVSQTGSFVVSASVSGTLNEIELEGLSNSGIRIGLPDNVSIPGILEAQAIVIQGQEQTETAAAIISGSTSFGTSGTNNTHKFTGSLEITGGLSIDNTNNDISISELTIDNTVGISDIIARSTTDQTLHTAGTAIGTAISGAFNDLSQSFAQTLTGLTTTTTTTNVADITALQVTSESLVNSSSLGIRLEVDGGGGTSISLGETASFTAQNTLNGLSVDTVELSSPTNGVNINYILNPTTIGNAIGAFSGSQQLQDLLDDVYVQLSDIPISGAQQLIDLGFITASSFTELSDVPTGLISGVAANSTGDQGTILINGNSVAINNLGTDDSPTFQNLTVTNNLTINGDLTALQVDNLNIEDQFILLNSGAGANENDKDGGIIVDNGGGSGSLFMYDFNAKAWGFIGATDNKVNFDVTSDAGGGQSPEVYVGTVSSSNNGVGSGPTDAPAYGLDASTAKGQIHVNTSDSSIWIYV